MRFRHLILFTLLVPALAPASPPALARKFHELSAACDSRELSPVAVAEVSWLAREYYAMGPSGVPDNRDWFLQSKTIGQTLVAGGYLIVHGKLEDLAIIRQEFETNRLKRTWLRALLGNEQRFSAAMATGPVLWPLTLVLPSTDGCRTLASLALRSPDTLVRRGGMCLGYWFADPSYWSRLKQVCAGDPDALNRTLATRILEGVAPPSGR